MQAQDSPQVCLLHPPSFAPECSADLSEFMESLGLGYIASSLDAHGIKATLLDAYLERYDATATRDHILARNPRVLGISSFVYTLRRCYEFVANLRDHGYQGWIVLGGHTASRCAKDILDQAPGIDAVVIGEGEQVFPVLCQSLFQDGALPAGLAGVVHRGPSDTCSRAVVYDIDALPFPRRDYWPRLRTQPGVFLQIIASRGCNGQCSFCSVGDFTRNCLGVGWRPRRVDAVIDEIMQVSAGGENQRIKFLDDDFLGRTPEGKIRAQALLRRLNAVMPTARVAFECRSDEVEEPLFSEFKQYGLVDVFLGVESGCQRTLDCFRKGITVQDSGRAIQTLRALGIRCKFGFIMFHPFSDRQELRENIAFLRLVNALVFHPYRSAVMQLYPGTELAAQCGTWVDDPEHHAVADYPFRQPECLPILTTYLRAIGYLRPLYDRINRNRLVLHDAELRQVNTRYLRFLKGLDAHCSSKLLDYIDGGMSEDALSDIWKTVAAVSEEIDDKLNEIQKRSCAEPGPGDRKNAGISA